MFHKILVPLDGSKIAEQALGPAAILARACGATLILLWTCETDLANVSLLSLAAIGDWPAEPNREVRNYLDILTDSLARQQVPTQSLAVKGDEAGAIIGLAEAQDIDLIIMTKHGRMGTRHDLIGDVTERVLYHASCSVMVICSDSPDEGDDLQKPWYEFCCE